MKRPRCRCGVYLDHSLWKHIAASVWLRIPEKRRWTIVGLLDKSQRRCWADLVSDAMAYPERDACDVHVPPLRGDRALDCASVCGWSHPTCTGEHACRCYCGKFQFTAPDGAIDRKQTTT